MLKRLFYRFGMIEVKQKLLFQHLEIILDAMSSVLSYNDLDLSYVLRYKKEEKEDDEDDVEDGDEEELHESTFAKQFVYFLLMTSFNIW